MSVPAEFGDEAGGAVIDATTFDAPHTRPSVRRAITVLAVGLAVWWIPLLAVIAWRGPQDVLSQEAIFFSTPRS